MGVGVVKRVVAPIHAGLNGGREQAGGEGIGYEKCELVGGEDLGTCVEVVSWPLNRLSTCTVICAICTL